MTPAWTSHADASGGPRIVVHARHVRAFSFLEIDMSLNERDVDVLARTIWGEARGEGDMSRARLVDNRSDTPPPTRYP